MKNKIREIALQKKKKLKNISEGTGIPYPTLMIYLKEENASEPSVTAALKIAKYLGVKVEELFILEKTDWKKDRKSVV